MGLQWREQLSVGNDVIDFDHRSLIDIINLVQEGLKARRQSEVIASLANLMEYLTRHSISEETIAEAVHYPHLPRLHECHEELLKTLAHVAGQLAKDCSPIAIEDFDALVRNWLVNDLLQEGLSLKPFLEAHSPLFDPR